MGVRFTELPARKSRSTPPTLRAGSSEGGQSLSVFLLPGSPGTISRNIGLDENLALEYTRADLQGFLRQADVLRGHTNKYVTLLWDVDTIQYIGRLEHTSNKFITDTKPGKAPVIFSLLHDAGTELQRTTCLQFPIFRTYATLLPSCSPLL